MVSSKVTSVIAEMVQEKPEVNCFAEGQDGDSSWVSSHGSEPIIFWSPVWIFNHFSALNSL